MENLTIYASSTDIIKQKMYCVKNSHKRNRYAGWRFCLDSGDIPKVVIRSTGETMDVVNTRGRAYGIRNRLKYVKKPTKFKGFIK